MVIGNGMIATAFKNYREQDDFMVVASGVSDSTHATTAAFKRERALLAEAIAVSNSKQLVYFSTCSVYDNSLKDSAYVLHKKNMEELIRKLHNNYVIFRLSNPVGNTKNNSTLVNFFIKNIAEQTHFDAWKNAARNIIDIDDMYLICDNILQTGTSKNETVNIAGPENYPIPFIIETIEKHFKIKANYTLVGKGDSPHIDTSAIEPLFRKFNINFGADYLGKLLQKYFPV